MFKKNVVIYIIFALILLIQNIIYFYKLDYNKIWITKDGILILLIIFIPAILTILINKVSNKYQNETNTVIFNIIKIILNIIFVLYLAFVQYCMLLFGLYFVF